MTEESATPRQGGDVLLFPTRLLAAVIIPVLLAAFTILFGFPGSTPQLWAWTIRPELASLVMGGAYLAGAWFFARGLYVGRWHRVAVGWLAVVPFTTLLGIATFMHWDTFNHQHVSFWAWLLLYTATPIALPLLWRRNQRTAGLPTTASGRQLATPLRVLMSGCGGALMAAAVIIFIRPTTVLSRWPWVLTPLTARTLASFATFLAVVWLAFGFTAQWDRLAIPFEASTLGLVIVAVAVVRGRHDLVGGPRTAVFGVLLGGAVLGSLTVLRRASRPSTHEPSRPHWQSSSTHAGG